ncbi:helix-turn-helix transcriptional regulator [Latilactobacillus curvatus]|uniref:helix-turn-helix transcriptional regulator n=1 Tax=Latilactobacillus curvatus TaxID=28038 RepID=UPI001FC95D86|nr:helix-turn-helix transcriptional regulator [Latilactobacillus curvatus]
MTQEQVAQKLLVTRQTVSRWEQDKTLPNVHVLKTLGVLYGIPIDFMSGIIYYWACALSSR